MSEMNEHEMTELAAYMVGLFAGRVSSDGSPATVAHALWLLRQEAERRRLEWLNTASRIGP